MIVIVLQTGRAGIEKIVVARRLILDVELEGRLGQTGDSGGQRSVVEV